MLDPNSDRQLDFALLGELGGVGKEVVDDLLKPKRIAKKANVVHLLEIGVEGVGNAGADKDSSGFEGIANNASLQNGEDERRGRKIGYQGDGRGREERRDADQREGDALQGELPSLELGVVEDVVDHAQKVSASSADHFDDLAIFGVQARSSV